MMTQKIKQLTCDCFVPVSLTILFNTTAVVAGSMILLWPFKGTVYYLVAQTAPLLSFLLALISMTINGAVQLSWGNNEIAPSEYFDQKKMIKMSLFFSPGTFFHRWVLSSLVHNGFLLLPHIPILLLSASLCAVQWQHFIGVVVLIYIVSFLCRMIGFLFYLVFKEWELVGFLLLRGFMIIIITFTAVKKSFLNPYIVLYDVMLNNANTGILDISSYNLFIYSSIGITAIILTAQYGLVHYRNRAASASQL